MSPDFWAGYISGAAGILIGNPLDILKVRLQSGNPNLTIAAVPTHSASSASSVSSSSLASNSGAAAATPRDPRSVFTTASSLIRGVSAPILGYGALNALLFVTYNRSCELLGGPSAGTESPGLESRELALWKVWIAGAVGGLATWVISTPSEVVKCRAQLSSEGSGGRGELRDGSWRVVREVLRREGVRGLFVGGGVTAARDAIGYGFYFWSYELMTRRMGKWMGEGDEGGGGGEAARVLLCGGLAGVVTWASVFPLDVVKTRVQTQGMELRAGEERLLLSDGGKRSSWTIAKGMYAQEGLGVFWRGFGVCSLRAFIVNAAQWAVYEWLMKELSPKKEPIFEKLEI